MSERIQSYRDLRVWQRAVELAVETHRLAARFPREKYGLANQMQQAAISVASGIAEGHGREQLAEYLHCLSLANGSLNELETRLIVARCLGYADDANLRTALVLSAQVGRMLGALIRSLKLRSHERSSPVPSVASQADGWIDAARAPGEDRGREQRNGGESERQVEREP